MYKSIKSCVMNNGVQWEFFDSPVGLRQEEKWSQLLFALFLNDMETFFPAQKWNKLKKIDKLYNDSNDGINGMVNLFVSHVCRWHCYNGRIWASHAEESWFTEWILYR
jgi:hypothetical protein